jgi:predicted membrane channel-forming protein YqfA (hemolysin III family)
MFQAAFYIGMAVFSIVVAVKLAKRLGYEGTTGLLMMLPVVNYMVLAVWAFAESPNERKIRNLQLTIKHLESNPGRSPVAFLEGETQAM